MYRKLSFVVVFVLISLTTRGQSPTRAFFVGHSLCSVDMPKMLSDLAADGGFNYQYDYQLIWGGCLTTQWNNHATPDVGSDSRVELATGDYDVLIMMEGVPLDEVVYGPWAGCHLNTRIPTGWFYDLAKTANPNTRGFMVEPWNEFNRNSPDYYQEWLDTNAVQAPLFQGVLDSVALQYPQYDRLCLIPLRQCYEALVDSIRQGAVPGLSHMLDIFDYQFDDPEHTFHANALGHYYSALVHYTAIFGVSPIGLTNQTYELDGSPYPAPSLALALKMQEIVWEGYAGHQGCLITNREEVDPASLELAVYPNPSQGQFRLQWEQGSNLSILEGQGSTLPMVVISDPSGREVYRQEVTPLADPSTHRNQISIDVSGLDAGMYLLQFTLGNLRRIEKIVLTE